MSLPGSTENMLWSHMRNMKEYVVDIASELGCLDFRLMT